MAKRYNWKKHARASRARRQGRAPESLDTPLEKPVKSRVGGRKRPSGTRRSETAALLGRLRRLELLVVTLVDSRITGMVDSADIDEMARRTWKVHLDSTDEDRRIWDPDEVLLSWGTEAAPEGEPGDTGGTVDPQKLRAKARTEAAGSRPSYEED